MPVVTLPVPAQFVQALPRTVPLPWHTGQMFSPVPGVPGGASSPGLSGGLPAPSRAGMLFVGLDMGPPYASPILVVTVPVPSHSGQGFPATRPVPAQREQTFSAESGVPSCTSSPRLRGSCGFTVGMM